MSVSAIAMLLSSGATAEPTSAVDFPALPLPPRIDALIGLPQTFTGGRREYLDLVTRAAEQAGLPPAVADSVAHVESRYNPSAFGGVGEIGLMQVRPETAAMLGHAGGVSALFVPEVNVRYGVMYLARAWQLADGDLCRALMKYRAGWGEERISPLSAEYCRRAREHLASIGSPLAAGMPAPLHERPDVLAKRVGVPHSPSTSAPHARPPAALVQAKVVGHLQKSRVSALQQAATKATRIRVASAGDVRVTPPLPPADARKARARRQLWAAYDARMREITGRLTSSQLRIVSGI